MLSLLLAGVLPLFREVPQDLDKILAKADLLLEESRKAYEDARVRSAPEAFVEAGFKLEEARIKYLVLQEIGGEAVQKTAAERLRAVQQLTKLINDGRVAVGKARTPAPEPPVAGTPAPPAPETPASPPPAPAVRPEADVLKRLPVPDAAAVLKTEKTVRELFKEPMAKKGAADQKALARLLLNEAVRMSDDPVGLYVLYRSSLLASLQGADLPSALSAGDEISRLFDVDGTALRMSTLTTAGTTAKAPPEFAELADAWLKVTYELMAADQYDPAEKAAASAAQHARKAGAPILLQRAATRAREITEAKGLFKALKGQLAILAETPDHPEANLEMGQFLCYVKDEWDLGLRFLAKGKDAVLKTLAEKEIALPTQAQDLASLADQWAELADKEKSPLRKGQMAAHARNLYEAALPAATGLLRTMIVKKLDAMARSLGPPPSKVPVDLLALMDPSKDALSGSWKFEQRVLVGTRAAPGAGRVQIPYSLPDEYDLTVGIERLMKAGDKGDIVIGLNRGDSHWTFLTTGPPQLRTGLDILDGVDFSSNETAGDRGVLPAGKPGILEIKVRSSGVTVLYDGKAIITWKGDYSRLSPSKWHPMNGSKTPYIGMWQADVRISKLLLTAVSGQGLRLR